MATYMEDGEASCHASTKQQQQQQQQQHVFVEDFRQHCESNKQWFARRQFILNNIAEYKEKDNIDQLLSLSMVWSNHVFMGCRYGSDLTKKVMEMADGIDVAETPSLQLVSKELKKRQRSADNNQEPVRKMSRFGRQLRFQPVHFISSGAMSSREEETKYVAETSLVTPEDTKNVNSSSQDSTSDQSCSTPATLPAPSLLKSTPYVFDPWANNGKRDTRIESVDDRGYARCAKASRCIANTSSSNLAKAEECVVTQLNSSIVDSEQQKATHVGSGTVQQEGTLWGKVKNRAFKSPEKDSSQQIPPDALEKMQKLFSKLSFVITAVVKDAAPTKELNYSLVLTNSTQTCRVNPEFVYVSLKDVLPSEQSKSVPSHGYACELRCQGVYLATGFSGSKNRAREQASARAVELLLQPVEVRPVLREHNHSHVWDMVVCQAGSPNPQLVPAFSIPGDKPSLRATKEPTICRRRANLKISGDVRNAVCVLKKSAPFNTMNVHYKFDQMPERRTWRCSVYVGKELLAWAQGRKVAAKQAAAEEALLKLIRGQAERPQEEKWPREELQEEQHGDVRCQDGATKQLDKLVILENSDNAICIINNTAQFNKIAVDYRLTQLQDNRWKCEIFLDDKYIAEGMGSKKSAKQSAANEALTQLKRTHAVVQLNKGVKCDEAGVSRDQIAAHTVAEHVRQEIKEDNIGNLMLRKMGWTGGGLGREGKGIAQPINVKEQCSRQGLGVDSTNPSLCLSNKDLEGVISAYAYSDRHDNLRFSAELSNHERKQVHRICHKFGLRSKSYGKGTRRFLLVSRKMQKEQLIGHLLQEGQIGQYKLVKPQALH